MTDRDLVLSVTRALACAEQTSLETIGYSLHEDIDPDILRTLDDQEHAVWKLSFEALDHDVTVTHEGSVFVDGVRFDGIAERSLHT